MKWIILGIMLYHRCDSNTLAHAAKDRTADPRTRVPRYWTIFEWTSTQIIFICMHDESPTPEIGRLHVIQEIRVACLPSLELDVPQIPRVTFSGIAGPWPASVVTRRTHMPMRAGALTALSAQIPRLVNMETVFARRKCREFHVDADPRLFDHCDSHTLNRCLFEHCNGHSVLHWYIK